MQRPSLGGLVNHKKATYYFVALILIVLASWLGYRHFHKTPAQSLDSSNAAFIDSLNSTAQQDLKSKDYPAALQALIPAGTTAISDNNWQQARDIYLTAINKIPDKYIDWSVYDSLVVIANALSDKNLEIHSLQKALAKAQQPNSGAPASTIALYKTQLKQLGSK